MYGTHRYCVPCGKYDSIRHKCDNTSIGIIKPTRKVMDRLYSLGFKPSASWIYDKCNGTDPALYLLQIVIEQSYPEYLFQELPEGWTLELDTSYALHYTYFNYSIKVHLGQEKVIEPAIAALEAYLDDKDPEAMRALITLSNG